MLRLVLALYAEGETDGRFLPPIIQRTTLKVLRQFEIKAVEVSFRNLSRISTSTNRNECILEAARRAYECNILFVHSDADHPTRERAYLERFLPGYELVQRTQGTICKSLVPIIPVRMTEAWMLAADHALFQEIIGTNMRPQELGLVNRARQVESIQDPKQALRQILQRAGSHSSRRHQNTDIHPLYLALGRRIDLDRLYNVPSYRRFVEDLTEALARLDFIVRRQG
jgi:hypothetical protein